MKRFMTIVTMVFLSGLISAQENIVPNGGFEDPYRCPNTSQGNLMNDCFSDWATPTIGSPDYYSFCADFSYYRPDGGLFGPQPPIEGIAFIGMYTFSLNEPQGREYAQVKLTQPIHAGVRYKVSFNVSLAELSRYAISSLGVYLSEEPPSHNEYWVIDVEPQIQNPAGNIIADTSGWVLVTDTFLSRAGGGEQWLTIGNFNYAADSDTFAFQPPNPDMGNFFHSYYYIDDVSVIALDSVPSGVGIDEVERERAFKVYPNPATETLNIKSAREIVGVRVLDAVGREVLHEQTLKQVQDDGSIDVSGLPPGMYLLEVTDREGRRATERFIKSAVP